MNIILFDSNSVNFYPLSFTRPVSEFRVGILTIKEKWEYYYKKVSVYTSDYLAKKYPLYQTDDNLWINSQVFPNPDLITEINSLRKGELLVKSSRVIAFRNASFDQKKLNTIETSVCFDSIDDVWDIFLNNGSEILSDYKLITRKRKSKAISSKNQLIGEDIFIEEGVKIECCILNSKNGPIYIGKGSEVMEGSVIRGPFAMGESSVLKMGTKIYGPTTLGPFCKVGGEVNNSVFFGYSSKSHDGFLGNSVIGEWCNIGAGTNSSNLKNNYSEVRLWNYELERFKQTGLQFCGLIMGDHSKSAINTMFNTGTVVGVSANVYGAGFPRNFIPSFSWGGSSGFSTFKIERVFEVVEKVMKRRAHQLDEVNLNILKHVFNMTERYRNS